MTVEEKAKKIEEFCRSLGERGCNRCPLFEFPENDCFDDIKNVEMINRNYEVLFGDSEVEDPINRPSHYTAGGIECIDAIAASMTPTEYAGFLKGQVFKYVWRYRLKGKPAEDLKKARFYLDRLIQITETEATV